MKFISTTGDAQRFSFKEAVLQNLAPDGGLFIPESIPELNLSDEKILLLNQFELLFKLLQPFVSDDLNDEVLKNIISTALDFEIPLKQIGDSAIYSLDLFHGPTWALKDVGARFLAGCLSHWSSDNQETTILVATSGDTGGAVANAFYQVAGTRVIILYPLGKISPLQEQQIAGLGSNIEAIAVKGTFDDCQQLVKTAFRDDALKNSITLTSANSINIARWIPQMIFYGIAYREALKSNLPGIICVPSGNYGNIAAGLLAHAMGMEFSSYLAAHNANDTVPRYIETGIYEPHPTLATIANAMDVSDPSNFIRFQWLMNTMGSNAPKFSARSIDDQEIVAAIRDCYFQYKYLLDPHSATAWKVLKDHGRKGIILSTAHPQKFEETIVSALGSYPEEWKLAIETNPINRIVMENSYSGLRSILLEIKK
ncbi:MAG: threonine synthase [Bacteroidota bacterium]|nr:threonine synthase [Bacteroidota bacterium]